VEYLSLDGFVVQSKPKQKDEHWNRLDAVLSAKRNLRAMLVVVMQRVGQLSHVAVMVLRGEAAAAYVVVGDVMDEERAVQLVGRMLQ
jgi:hypothetical protein